MELIIIFGTVFFIILLTAVLYLIFGSGDIGDLALVVMGTIMVCAIGFIIILALVSIFAPMGVSTNIEQEQNTQYTQNADNIDLNKYTLDKYYYNITLIKYDIVLTMTDMSNVSNYQIDAYGNFSHLNIYTDGIIDNTIKAIISSNEHINYISIKLFRYGYWQEYQFFTNESFYRIGCPCQKDWCIDRLECGNQMTHLNVLEYNLYEEENGVSRQING